MRLGGDECARFSSCGNSVGTGISLGTPTVCLPLHLLGRGRRRSGFVVMDAREVAWYAVFALEERRFGKMLLRVYLQIVVIIAMLCAGQLMSASRRCRCHR